MPTFAAGHSLALFNALTSPRFTLPDPPAPPQSRRKSTPPVAPLDRSLASSRPCNARKPPGHRQIPIDRTARTAEYKRPAVSSPEACPTPPDRVCRNPMHPAGVRQPFTTTEVSDGPENVRSWGQSGSRFRTAGGLLLAISRLSRPRNSDRNLAHRDAGGGSRPPHQERTYERA